MLHGLLVGVTYCTLGEKALAEVAGGGEGSGSTNNAHGTSWPCNSLVY